MDDGFSIEDELEKIEWTVPDDHLKAGRSIYYCDERFPDQIIREDPNGTKTLVEFNGTDLIELKTLE